MDGLALLTAKAAVIAASALMAIASVLVDMRKHTFASALLAIVIGTAVGVIAASSVVAIMGWPEQAGYGVAGIFAISGQNIVKWLLRVSADPLKLWKDWRGKK
jgi:hypothetical protein